MSNRLFSAKRPAVPLRGIHLDLKGSQPTPARMLQLMDVLAATRLNCALIEWEDTFPWKRYPELKSPTAYTPEFIGRLMDKAGELGIEIIPLVQCFGHSENVLSHVRFRRLREVPDNVAEFCPSDPRSAQLIIELVDDVLALSRGLITRFHLGGDEAWHMGSCPKCRKAVKAHGRDWLYLKHVTPILDHLNDLGVRPILWDDMMRKWPVAAIKEMGRKADLMSWAYGANPVGKKKEWLNEGHLRTFKAASVTNWGASAYKGGDGAFVDLPNPAERAKNNLAWAAQAKKHGLAGVVMTAWSRYNTFLSPCETIEASLDCLVFSAAALWDGKLPRDYVKASHAFLKRYKGGREWHRFSKCQRAAAELGKWQKGGVLYWLEEELERAACLNGEPKRINPAIIRRARERVRMELAKGKKLGDAFIAAHRGAMPEMWLKLYVASRLMPLARRAKAVGA